ADGADKGVLEQLELGLAADERRRERAHRTAVLAGAHDAAGGDRLAPTAQLEWLERLELDEVPHESRRRGADDDLVRARLLLEARGEVDRFAGGERRVRFVGDDLAGLDPNAHLEVELAHAVDGHEGGADCALGVVLVLERNAESG